MQKFRMHDSLANISDISVSEIDEQDLAQLDRDGYSFHPSKYQTKSRQLNIAAPSEDTTQANVNSSTLNFGTSDLHRLESDFRDAKGTVQSKSSNLFFSDRNPDPKKGISPALATGKSLSSNVNGIKASPTADKNQRLILNKNVFDNSPSEQPFTDENQKNTQPFGRILSPPLTSATQSDQILSEKDPLKRLQAEYLELKTRNQKLLELLSENNQLVDDLQGKNSLQPHNNGTASLRLEISKLTAKVANLEMENAQLKEQAQGYPQSPLAEYSLKKAAETRQQIERTVQLDYESKFIEYKELCNNEYLLKFEKCREDFEKNISAMKAIHQSEVCKCIYQIEQLKNENVNLEKTVQSLREESLQTVQKLNKEHDSRISDLMAVHQRSTNEMIERISKEKETDLSALKAKYRQDLQSLSEKLKLQFNQMLQKMREDYAQRERQQAQQFEHQQQELRQQLAEKESIFVNSVIPFDENSNAYRKMQQKLDALSKENTQLLQAKQKLLEKVKRKFREKVSFLKQAFQLQKERMQIEFDRRLSEKMDHLYSKYRLKLVELKTAAKS